MNNYIEVNLTDRNEFRCTGSFKINGIDLLDLDFKIDTGCSYSSIPLLRTPLDEDVLHKMMVEDYMDENVEKHISFGVNDSSMKRKADTELFKNREYTTLASVTCVKNVQGFTLSDVNLGDLDVWVSYRRTGNILIGMDILKLLDIHIATIKKDRKTVMLACPLDRINDDYLKRLEELYSIGSNIASALIRDEIQ